MYKDLNKVKAGDFFKSLEYDDKVVYGLVIQKANGELALIGKYIDDDRSCWMPLRTDKVEYRRMTNAPNVNYTDSSWKHSFSIGKLVYRNPSEIEIDIRINGRKANLSDISEETLIKLRKEN